MRALALLLPVVLTGCSHEQLMVECAAHQYALNEPLAILSAAPNNDLMNRVNDARAAYFLDRSEGNRTANEERAHKLAEENEYNLDFPHEKQEACDAKVPAKVDKDIVGNEIERSSQQELSR